MTKDEICEIASINLSLSVADAKRYCQKISNFDSNGKEISFYYYFYNPLRGGQQMVINEKGEKLIAPSSFPSRTLVSNFLRGDRN